MKENLNRHFLKLEQLKQRTLSFPEELSGTQINYRPESEGWSIGQVLYHMYQVEAFSLQYMKKKVENTTSPESTSLPEKFRVFLLRLFLALPIKFKAPDVVSKNIPDQIDYDSLKASWETTRKDLYNFVDGQPLEMLQHKIFRHPTVGLINIEQTLVFYHAHIRHHWPQLRRLLSKIKRDTVK